MIFNFNESDMTFPFDTDNCYRIEKSETYRSLGEGIKICEAIVRKSDSVLFIEAKSSFSNPSNSLDFKENVNEIYHKFLNSILIYSGILINRPYQTTEELPINLKLSSIKRKKFKCILIINNFEREWLPPVSDAINSKFINVKKAFKIDSLIVMNKEIALSSNIIQEVPQ